MNIPHILTMVSCRTHIIWKSGFRRKTAATRTTARRRSTAAAATTRGRRSTAAATTTRGRRSTATAATTRGRRSTAAATTTRGGGQPPPRPPQGGGGQPPPRPPQGGGPPHKAPPLFIPQFPGGMIKAIDAGSMKGCLYQNTYVWLINGRSFWFYPTYVGYNSVAGYRWRQSQQRWAYYGTDASEIRSFQCY